MISVATCPKCGEPAKAVSRFYENESVIWFYEHESATHAVKMSGYDSDLKLREIRKSSPVTRGKSYL